MNITKEGEEMKDKLILKENQCYILRNGLKTSPLKLVKHGGNYKFEARFEEFKGRALTVGNWLQGGHYLLRDYPHPNDIIKVYDKESN